MLLSVLFHIFVSLKSSSYLVAPSFKGSAVLLRTVSVALPCNGSVVLLLINGSVAPSYNGSVAPTYNGSVAPSQIGLWLRRIMALRLRRLMALVSRHIVTLVSHL